MIEIRLSQIVREHLDRKKRLQWEDAVTAINSPTYQNFLKSDDPELFLSLRDLDYIDSDGLLWILLLGDFLNEKGKMVWLELPSNKWQLNFLKKSYFVETAQECFSITNLYKLDDSFIHSGIKRKNDNYLRFWKVDISSINKLSTVYLHKTVSNVLNKNILDHLDFTVIQPFVNLIVETNRNLIQHSRGKHGEGWGYFVLSEKPTKFGKRLTCTIGDNGIGFKKSLIDKGLHIRNDQEAINRALLFRYHNREGAGLFRAVQFASRLSGVIRVRSGQASSFINFNNTYLENENSVHDFISNKTIKRLEKVFFPGVQIYVEALGDGHARR